MSRSQNRCAHAVFPELHRCTRTAARSAQGSFLARMTALRSASIVPLARSAFNIHGLLSALRKISDRSGEQVPGMRQGVRAARQGGALQRHDDDVARAQPGRCRNGPRRPPLALNNRQPRRAGDRAGAAAHPRRARRRRHRARSEGDHARHGGAGSHRRSRDRAHNRPRLPKAPPPLRPRAPAPRRQPCARRATQAQRRPRRSWRWPRPSARPPTRSPPRPRPLNAKIRSDFWSAIRWRRRAGTDRRPQRCAAAAPKTPMIPGVNAPGTAGKLIGIAIGGVVHDRAGRLSRRALHGPIELTPRTRA